MLWILFSTSVFLRQITKPSKNECDGSVVQPPRECPQNSPYCWVPLQEEDTCLGLVCVRLLPCACLCEAWIWPTGQRQTWEATQRAYSFSSLLSLSSSAVQVCSFTLLPTDMIFLSTVPAVTCLLYWSFLCMFFVLFTIAFLCQHQERCFQSNSLYLMWSIN